VEALTNFSGPDIRAKMMTVARSDPANRDNTGKRVYPVRAAALAWIARDDSLKRRSTPR